MEEYILVAKYLCTSLRISFEFLEVEFLGQWVCTKKLDFIRTAKWPLENSYQFTFPHGTYVRLSRAT